MSLDEHVTVGLSLPGGRKAPDPEATALAAAIPTGFDSWRPAIVAALLEHAAAAGSTGHPVPDPAYAAVVDLDGQLTLEFGYRVAWDDDHMLGACVRDGALFELNGSVLEP